MLDILGQVTYTTSTSSSDGATGAAIAGILLFSLLFGLAIWAVMVVALWKIFEKAGEDGWRALIPGYNVWVLFEVSGKPGWWGLVPIGAQVIGIIPILGWFLAGPIAIAGIVLYVIAVLELAKRFNKSTTFAVVGLIIFSLIGQLILGFGDAKYTGKVYRTLEPNGGQ